MIKIQYDEFLSKSFNKSFYNLEIEFKENNLNILSHDLLSLPKNSVFTFKINKKLINFKEIEMLLYSYGFYCVGNLYTYQLMLQNFNQKNTNGISNVRFALKKDLEKLKDIAFTSFSDDRFHQDKNLDNHLANNYYSSWIENSLLVYEDPILVFEENSILQGFISYRIDKENSSASILLNAIDSKFRQGGRYSSLLNNLIHKLQEININKLNIGTYENSLPVHKTMKKFGFLLSFINSIYHLHT